MFVQNNNNVLDDYSLYISEMKDNNDTRDRRDEVGVLGYYKVLAVPMERYSVI